MGMGKRPTHRVRREWRGVAQESAECEGMGAGMGRDEGSSRELGTENAIRFQLSVSHPCGEGSRKSEGIRALQAAGCFPGLKCETSARTKTCPRGV